ncbi:DnaJ domain-containing protein [Lishizhenia tianjinensis]|uniref:DnaJ domain-containing protein n=1 Tax=Lishizhenia tianjinensis TaxID=477690 RepID=A0A1I6Y7V2_9FLAO|nr:DnaJ domain-containing protein [Lishizhenia tianjinensis]SFT46599.1 DnaJ domain-containing protein [Lishizhenia tianjinensis]
MTLNINTLLLEIDTVQTVVFILFLMLAVLWGKNYYESSFWTKGEIPLSFGKSKENFIEILIALSYNVMKLQHEGYREKQKYLYDYLKKFNYFETAYEFQNSFAATTKMPLKSASIVKWINKHYPNENQRLNIAYFIAGMCFQDGEISPKEMKYLHTFTRGLKIGHHFEAIIGSYQQKEEQKRKQNTKTQHRSTQTNNNLVFKILEIQPTEDFAKIKKAYRKLVKIHHPDRLTDASELEISIAQDRFIEIQKAYEILEKRYA